MKQREIHLDYLAALFIIFMMWTHVQSTFNFGRDLYNIIAKFMYIYMPWFFFKNGMFFRKSPMLCEIRKSFSRLIMPWICFIIISVIFVGGLLLFTHNLHFNYFPGIVIDILQYGRPWVNTPLWFLLTLFFTRAFVNVLPSNNYVYVVVAVIMAFGAWLCEKCDFSTPQYLSTTLIGSVFFISGIVFKQLQYTKSYFFVSFIGYVLINIFCSSCVSLYNNNLSHGYYFIFIISSLCGIIFFNNVFRQICRRESVISYIGKSSMVCFTTHFPLIIAVQLFGEKYNITNEFCQFISSLFLFVLLIPLFNYVLNKEPFGWIIGNTRKK